VLQLRKQATRSALATVVCDCLNESRTRDNQAEQMPTKKDQKNRTETAASAEKE
tara:strand:+ start:295 stop:456 length:162 start_codon:yes stop_codon:yes gene_type:complete